MEPDVRLAVKGHGTRQIEFKSRFPLGSGRRERYSLDVWSFFPSSLGINSREYGTKQFFTSTRSLTRFSPLRMPLSDIVNPENELSPFVRIRKTVGTSPHIVIYELRSLANMYSAESLVLERRLLEEAQNREEGKLKSRVKKTLKEMQSFLDQWHEFEAVFESESTSENLLEAYRWTDESILITTEKFLSDLFKNVVPDDEKGSILKRILNLADHIQRHRLKMGYLTPEIGSHGMDVEDRIFRESILKKWRQSVLYLTHEESRVNRNMTQIIAGISAAIAMAFALLTTLIVSRRFPTQGLSWALALIVVYIFKDRIKDIVKGILAKTIPSWITDERIILSDRLTDRRIGSVRSRVMFGKSGTVSARIRQAAGLESDYFNNLLPEKDVLHLRRGFTIRNRVLRKYHRRLDFLTDIVRINLQEILGRMDDPEKTIPVFSEGEPVNLKGHRVYRINLVGRLANESEGTAEFFRYRIILDRKGIRRIENLERINDS